MTWIPPIDLFTVLFLSMENVLFFKFSENHNVNVKLEDGLYVMSYVIWMNWILKKKKKLIIVVAMSWSK